FFVVFFYYYFFFYYYECFFYFFFFFSSRRRHTRYWRDWSSDVCSSDLDVGVLVERIADAQSREAALELRDERLVDRLLDEETRAGAAHVSLVEVDAVDDPLDGLVERRVVEDDVRGLASQFERELLAGAGEPALDRLPHVRRAGEGDLVDIVALDECGARASVARDDVDDPGRELGLAENVAEEQRRQRRRLGG